MHRESRVEREAWTALVEGRTAKPRSKFGNNNRVKEGGYHSDKEALVATKLAALASRGTIKNLREQVPVVLVPGKRKIKDIIWIADFVYEDGDGIHYLDAKGCKTAVYRLKKKLAAILLDINIEEV